MDTTTLEIAATLLTKNLQNIDPAEITGGIRNLTIDPMTYKEPNFVGYFLVSLICTLYYDKTNAKISQQSFKSTK